MAVTQTSLGTYGATFTYDASETGPGRYDTSGTLLYAINTWLTEGGSTVRGWVLDAAKSGDGYSTYYAVNAPAPTYNANNRKWCRLDFTAATDKLFFAVSETGNFASDSDNPAYYSYYATGHSSWGDGREFAQCTKFGTGGSINIYASPRWLLGCSVIPDGIGSHSGNSFCGCIEISRDNIGDTYERVAGNIPPWGWCNGYLLSQNLYCFSFVKTLSGRTLLNASQTTAMTTELGCANTYWGTLASLSYQARNNWDLSLLPTSQITVANFTDTATLDEYRGRLFGLKLGLYNYLSFNDRVVIRCDSDLWPIAYNAVPFEDIIHRVFTAGAIKFYIPTEPY
jgi:hypothetical protein